jgi:transcriptional regulator with GAF, ATPase, and Fis domain/tetratricopeptide (TPR) repeat protein
VAAANIVDTTLLPARYAALEPLGQGASGEAYGVVDTTDGVACVAKVFAAGAGARGAAIAELAGLQALAHPSVVQVRDIGRLGDGRMFLVTERLSGPSLDTLANIADEPARRAAVQRAAQELAGALAHLHGRGIVHADICPANVRLAGDGRAVLIDFGLAGPPVPGDGAARGTLGYAAPEALTGARSAAVDLFALGATLFEAWSGAPPFGRGLTAVQRVLTEPAPVLSSIRPGLGEGWDRLIARLLAADPGERPASAREVLREVIRLSAGANTPAEVDLGVPYPEGDPLAGIFVGRRAERAALRGILDRLAEGACPVSTLVLAGAPGAGRRALFDVVAREVTVAGTAGTSPAVHFWRGSFEALATWLQVETRADSRSAGADPQRAGDARLAVLAEALEARARAEALCVWLDEDPAAEAFAAWAAGAPPSGRLLLVVPARAALGRPFADTIALEKLTAADVEALIAGAGDVALPAGAAAAIAAQSQGNAAIAGVLARRLIANLRAGRGADVTTDSGADLDGLLEGGYRALPPDAQALVLALAMADGTGDPAALAGLADAAAVARAAADGRAAGWLEAGADGALHLPSAAHRRAALAAASPALCARIAEPALALLGDDDPRRAEALVAAGRPADAVTVLRRAAETAARADGAPARAALLYARASAIEPGALDAGERLALATGLGLLGRYEDAARAIEDARSIARDGAARAACAERDGWLRARRGDTEGARVALERGLADGAGGTAALELRARLGRLLVTSGRFRDALDTVEPLAADGTRDAVPAAVRAVASETTVLAFAYLGQSERARDALAALARTGAVPDGRHTYLGALLAQLAGREAEALDGYRRAYEQAARDGDVHTVASVALNLGALLAEQGLYGEALAASERAVRELGRLGAGTELATALVNGANIFVQIGDLSAARRALDRARGLATERKLALALAAATFVEGDLALRAGQASAAAAAYRAAAAAFVDEGQEHRAASALYAAAEAAAQAGQADAGRRALAEADALRAPSDDDGERARALAALALADGGGEPAPAAADRLDRLARRVRAADRRPQAFRLAVLAARLAERAGAANKLTDARRFARTTMEEIRMATPEHHRAGLERDPDALWVAGPDAARPGDAAVSARALAAEGRLRRLLRINKRLNSELRLPRLLEMIVDTVIELTDAERGFLLLEDEHQQLEVKVARNIDQRTLETVEFELSRSIARQAAAGGEPIVTIDAAGDARFREALSVSDLHLRSVLAVPLVIKGRAAGTIYVDHRLRKGAFDQEDVRLVLDFAEQAAIALENARLLGELRRRERQVEALNRRLEVELAAKREELSGIKQELRDNREALAVRYDYRNIIGKTPRMLDLFRLLDRITDTTLPVVIQGESGTGKELVARAIHANGPRRDRPFIAENCAAIPETLLESTLFGYQRGAFTGAERDTRGLFEVADGGTLFLDEVAEMSPGMQGKLLRVLQLGELRRVGSEHTRKVDVRIVTASNRDLARMVEEGKFRRDLFFRLNVAQISLPPLRDRRDDIPLMVEHFLAKVAAAAGRTAPKPLDAAALTRLVAYRWPGNVRELENEITRAEALSGDRIGIADLSPAVAAAGDLGAAVADDPDNLLLKPRVERLERSLLREALGRAANNQTKAAEILGLSRFGLQKKLKRYNFSL